jgi:aryl-alcohol dehydrogenase-like predicted oxidoreductase
MLSCFDKFVLNINYIIKIVIYFSRKTIFRSINHYKEMIIDQGINMEVRPTYIKGDYTRSRYFKNGSRLVCGTYGLGGSGGEVDEGESTDIILYALDRGVRVFDTAPSFGNAQHYLGRALDRWSGPKPFISTRVGRLKADEMDKEIFEYSPATMRQSLEESLELIGLEKADLLFLDRPDRIPLDRIDEIIDTLKGFKKEGLVDMLGISGDPEGGVYKYIKKENFEVMSGLHQLNACNLDAMLYNIPLLKTEGIAYYNSSVLHMALLGSKLEQYSRERPDTKWIRNRDVDIAVMSTRIASKNNLSISSMALRYAFSILEADRVVLGARKMHQMEEALDCWEDGLLTEDVFNDVTDNIIAGYNMNK